MNTPKKETNFRTNLVGAMLGILYVVFVLLLLVSVLITGAISSYELFPPFKSSGSDVGFLMIKLMAIPAWVGVALLWMLLIPLTKHHRKQLGIENQKDREQSDKESTSGWNS